MGQGSFTNAVYAIGGPNGNYAELYGGNRGDGASIIVNFTKAYSSGHLTVFGYSNTGYYSHVIIKFSADGTTWTTASDTTWY